MSTKKQRQRRPAAKRHEPDWEALRALTDEEIAAQIAANPDAAPDLDWSLDDPKVRIMVPTDVKAIRAKFGLSQEQFAKAFALKLATLRDWEQARALLKIIDREPAAVRRALAPERQGRPKTARRRTASGKPRHTPVRRAAKRAR